MAHNRPDRVGDLIKEEIASMILHGEVKDPRVGFVTITGVSMSRDLKNARVYFSLIGSKEDVENSSDGLNSACPFIRRALAKRLKLKYIPDVSFEFDTSLEYADHIEKVIKGIKEEE